MLKNRMKKINRLILVIFLTNFSLLANASEKPYSFADLAEQLMPSVVFISTTTTTVVNQTDPSFPFKFPPGSPFEEMFKDFDQPRERKASSLGSGFIIDKDGIVITNNHVIQNAEDILVKVGSKEYSAKVIGAGLAVIGVIGSGIGIGNIFSSFIEAVGRNPAARGEVFTMTMLGFALVEAIALFALVIALVILFG